MTRKLGLALAVLVPTVLVLLAARALAAGPTLDPARTFVFSASIVKWPESAGLAEFTDERRDAAFVSAFGAAGVSSDNITFLTDEKATLAAIRSGIRALAARAGEGSTLVLAFQGHGGREAGDTWFMPYDVGEDVTRTAFAFSEIGPILESCWKGERLVLVGDCCHSGALADVVARFEKSKVKAACFTSATASNRSTGHWTFTEALIDGLRGDGRLDRDHDGTVTFAETDRWIHEAMKYREGQLTHATRTTSFEADFCLHAVATKVPAVPGDVQVGDFVEAMDRESKWYLADVLSYADGKYHVHYEGWESKWDEDVAKDRLRAPRGKTLEVGSRYEVEWDEGDWYPGTVTKVEEGWFYWVHYEGENGQDDEWITPDRARKPSKPEFAPRVKRTARAGDVVAARWRTGWYLATVEGQEGKLVRVRHQDGSTARVTKRELIVVARPGELTEGDRVLACWNDGAQMYPGKVEKKGEKTATVRWEDGSEPSEVAFGKLARIKP